MSTKAGQLFHPTNKQPTDIYNGFSWPCFFFGPLWFAVKGLWLWAVVSFLLGGVTLGLSWIIFPFFANGMHRKHLLSAGYLTAEQAQTVQPSTITMPLAATNVQPSATAPQSVLGNQEFKNCPYCGEQIAAKAIKCKHCQTTLTEGNTSPSSPAIDKAKAVEEMVLAFHTKHRSTHPEFKKGLFGNSHHSHVYGGAEITSDVLKTHNDHLEGFNPNTEKLLLVVNKPSGLAGMAGGIVLTNCALYYKVTTGMMKSAKGRMDIGTIKSMVIGGLDTAIGTAYEGHEFYVNGQKLGWLRMGTDAEWDDETLNYTTELFKKLTETVWSR